MTKRKEKKEAKALAIFVKNPELGNAKTRIAKDSDDKTALAIYKTLLNITRNITMDLDINKYVFYSKHIDLKDDWTNEVFNKKLQGGKDLGEKMSNGFQVLFNERFEKVLLIGSDCPYITKEILELAYEKLNNHDFVFGPTFDGGYYLVGMKQFNPMVFSGIEWSTEDVLKDSIQRVETMSGKYFLLPKLKDIDHLTDWEEYKSRFN